MSLNFKMSELIKSDTANMYKINNMPDINSLDNMLNLIVNLLQPLRDKLKKPIIITSGYRCKELNDKIGGAANSQHLKGQAADITVSNMSTAELFNFIKSSGIPFDQLINEHDAWVHVSYNITHNRHQFFKI